MIITLIMDVTFVEESNLKQFLVVVDVIFHLVRIVDGSVKHTLVQQ